MKKDYILRIVKTFFQGAFAYLGTQLLAGIDINNKEVIKTLAVGLIGAGLSAVMNVKQLASDLPYADGESEEEF